MTCSHKEVTFKQGNRLLKTELHPHQLDALNFHLSRKYSINGFEMGLGKTVIALALAETVGSTAVIVCPAYLKIHWTKEIAKFSKKKANYKLISYSALKNWRDIFYQFGNAKIKAVVFDEMHYLKNHSALRTQAAHEMVKNIAPDYLLGLTGTPIKNRVPEWWSLLKIMSYGSKHLTMGPLAHNYLAFCRVFSFEHVRKIGNRRIVEFKGIKNQDTLRELVRPVYLRKKAKGLPDRVAKSIHIGSKECVDLADQLDADFEAAYSMSEAKKLNALSKTQYTIKFCQDFLNQDIRPVIFTDHVAACQAIADHFKVPALHGGTPTEARALAVDEFEKGKLPVLVCTFGAMSTGHSVVSTNQMIINDYPWVPADLAQAEGRIRRLTQKKTCFYTYIFGSEIDEKIFNTIKSKMEVVKKAIGGESD